MKKLIISILTVFCMCSTVFAAQLVIDQVGVYTNPQAMFQAIDDNFDELYTWMATVDTENELKILYNLEDADITTLSNTAINTAAKLETVANLGAYASDILSCVDQAALIALVASVAPTNITPVDTGDENATFYIPLLDGATGSQAIETDGELTYNPNSGLLTVPGISTTSGVTTAGTTSGGQYMQLLEATDKGAHYAGWGVYGNIVASYLLAPPLAVPTAGQMLVFAVPGNQTMSDGSSKSVAVGTWADPVTASSTTEFTNKTLDANDTGNVIKGYGYILLQKPNHFGAGVTQQTTATAVSYGQALFVDDTDKATNWVEYVCEVPRDIDTSVNLAAWFKFKLGGADTGDHEYEISMISVAASAAYDGTPANAVSLGYSADASGADGDVEEASLTDLTDWESNVTAGNLWVIRVARDGDHANDTSTVDSYSGPLTIRYGFTQ